jgi:hypothetical protein
MAVNGQVVVAPAHLTCGSSPAIGQQSRKAAFQEGNPPRRRVGPFQAGRFLVVVATLDGFGSCDGWSREAGSGAAG